MSLTFRNAAPRSNLLGIKDDSTKPAVYEPEAIPTHLPHVFLFTERGETLPQLAVGDSMLRKYGARSFDYKSPYATHQTVLAEKVSAKGNSLMVQRLVPPGANPPASLRLSVDIVPELVPTYQRNADGTHTLDANGNKIPTGDMIEGFNLRWIVGPTINPTDDGRLLETGDPRLLESGAQRILDSKIGDGAITVGQMTNTDGVQSQIYPILDFEVADFGDYGNRLGVRFSAPTSLSDIPVDVQTIEEQLAYLYRLQFVERAATSTTAKVLENLSGERYVDFALKEGVFNPRTDKELFLDDAVLPSFSQEPVNGAEEIRAPFGRIHLYSSNLEAVLDMVQVKESPYGYVPADAESKHLINVFTGHDYNGIPYESLVILGPADNGILLSSTSTHYCVDGYDGVMNYETFDLVTRFELENYGDLEAKVLDTAKYPQAYIYDTGFALETKKAMLTVIGRRKDMGVIISTQDVMQAQNTASEETSIATALRTRAAMYPESVIYGTSVCRAIVVAHSGYLLNSPYKGLLPLTIELAEKAASYMGAGNGVWKNGEAFDVSPNNQVTMFKGVNATYRPVTAREKDWEIGLVWVQNYDRRSLFFPGIQTVYEDDSSILNSAINMMAAIELEKVADRVWRDLTGRSDLTPGQFIERSNKKIEAAVKGRFDNRIIVVPDTYYTENDEQRGYSWACNINMYGANMKTVGTYTVTARRIEDYAG